MCYERLLNPQDHPDQLAVLVLPALCFDELTASSIQCLCSQDIEPHQNPARTSCFAYIFCRLGGLRTHKETIVVH